jgi:RND family efflux transporter MFP subunit
VRSSRGRPALLLLAASLLLACGDPASSDVSAGTREREVAAPAAQRVRVAEVRRGSLQGLSGVTGITRPFRSATAAAEVGARVVERHVEPGVDVEAGDPLVSLDDTHLKIAVDEARAVLQAREVDLAEASRELTRGEELARQGAISDGRHDSLRFAAQRARSARDLAAATLRRAERARADAVVRAPFAGSVERVAVQVGDVLAPGTAVAEIADFGRVRMVAGVTAAEAAELRPGITASVSIPALGGYRTTAPIHSVGQMADPATGTYPVELWLDNAERRMREGMVGQLELPTPEGQTGVIAPRAAILRNGGLAVYVVEVRDGRPRAVVRPVRAGRVQGELIELLEGVEPGERVVVDGQFALVDGAAVFVDAPTSEGAPAETTWND